ncbi:Uncharacterised protein [Vibrio cholerae]|nr:Uncharacterised protein [Vibrio cholerae]CSI29496.1 Uncharacterised protein [Vibrio cholerae]
MRCDKRIRRSSKGITKSLDTMIARAMVETITIPEAADVPPKKANNAIS